MDEPIRLRQVWKSFGGRPGASPSELLRSSEARVAVQDVSLSVRTGEIFVLMGLSGSGKSTLLRMINGLIAPSHGVVDIEGRSLQQFSRSELQALRRRSMAMVFQSFALFPQRSALENAAFGLEVAGIPRRQRLARAQQALERVGLGQDLHRKPDQLSGGMRQRVGLARALALDPPVLLMDEAFSALDPLIRSDMQDLLLDLQREHRRTIVFISHDLDEAVRIGDRIALMQDGRLLQCDAAETLFRSPAEPAVAEFFRGVDPAGVLTVGAIADPSAPSVKWDPTNPDLTVLSSTMLIKEAIPIVTAANGPVAVVGPDHHLIGAVSPNTILRALSR
jgi:glycine betaine/proline transport system ATP-binding protein